MCGNKVSAIRNRCLVFCRLVSLNPYAAAIPERSAGADAIGRVLCRNRCAENTTTELARSPSCPDIADLLSHNRNPVLQSAACLIGTPVLSVSLCVAKLTSRRAV